MARLLVYKRIALPVAGTVSWNTPLLQGDIVSVHIKPTTATTSYGFNIVGVNGLKLFETGVDVIGELMQSFQADSCNEVMTCTITDATVNENFTVELRIKLYENIR
jgi:hypothetical protein